MGSHSFDYFTVEVIDAMEDYVGLLKRIFDFDALSKLMKKANFKFLFDALNGVMGPFAYKVLVEELGASPEYLQGATPLPDFGGYVPGSIQR